MMYAYLNNWPFSLTDVEYEPIWTRWKKYSNWQKWVKTLAKASLGNVYCMYSISNLIDGFFLMWYLLKFVVGSAYFFKRLNFSLLALLVIIHITGKPWLLAFYRHSPLRFSGCFWIWKGWLERTNINLRIGFAFLFLLWHRWFLSKKLVFVIIAVCKSYYINVDIIFLCGIALWIWYALSLDPLYYFSSYIINVWCICSCLELRQSKHLEKLSTLSFIIHLSDDFLFPRFSFQCKQLWF